MSIRNQPYLPLYVQDFLTDEKLAECSAQATGVYIRIMCLMHKSDPYGKILLKEKFKQTDKQDLKQELKFALQIAKHFPYDLLVVENAIIELVAEKVLIIEGGYLVQKRMVKDASTSEKRSVSGSKGGQSTQEKNKKFAKAKPQANAEIEIDIEYEDNKESIVEENRNDYGDEIELPIPTIFNMWMLANPNYQSHPQNDFSALLQMFEFFTGKEITQVPIEELKTKMGFFITTVANDTFLRDKPLNTIKSQMQKIKGLLVPKKREMVY